jgi:hypothetical protein
MLLWSAIINYAVLLLWFLLMLIGKVNLHRLTNRWFRMTAEQFDLIQYGGIVLYKLGIILFNLVPYIALRIVA